MSQNKLVKTALDAKMLKSTSIRTNQILLSSNRLKLSP